MSAPQLSVESGELFYRGGLMSDSSGEYIRYDINSQADNLLSMSMGEQCRTKELQQKALRDFQ